MPTNRTKRTRNQTPELTTAQVEHLLSGNTVKIDFSYPEDQRKEDWQKYKEPLLKYWTSDLKEKYMKEPHKYSDEIIGFAMPEGPFTRPAAWWDYEAPEPRRCLNYGESEIMHRSDCDGPGYGLQWVGDRGFPRFKNGKYCPAEFESQKEYLIRLDLLTETEKQLLDNE